jgi:protein subunit release factor A
MTHDINGGRGCHPTRIVEIRAGEGGADARVFVAELATAYLRLASGHA